MIVGINCFLILPLIFNFYIIPRIEKQIGKKLEYTLFGYNLFFFNSYFVRYGEIALYVFYRSLKLNIKNEEFALKKVNYDISTMQTTDKVLCFIVIFHFIYFIIAALAVAIITK